MWINLIVKEIIFTLKFEMRQADNNTHDMVKVEDIVITFDGIEPIRDQKGLLRR